jgi:surface protein
VVFISVHLYIYFVNIVKIIDLRIGRMMDASESLSRIGGRAHDVANEILRQHGMTVEYLPLLTDNDGWKMLRDDFKLIPVQIMALRKLVSTAVTPTKDVVHEEFSMSPVGELRNCLDYAADVTVMQAILGPGRCVFDLFPDLEPSSGYVVTREAVKAVILTHQDWLLENSPVPFDIVSLELQLILRIYTAKFPFPIFQYVNRCLNCTDRKARLVAIAPFTKLAIRALRAMEAAGYVKTVPAYRGMTVEGNAALRAKYDNYATVFNIGMLITFPAFTSVSLEDTIANLFGDKIFFHFIAVRGIDVSGLSAFPEERELVITPPGVVRVIGIFMVKGHLMINVELVNQPDATYLSVAALQTALELPGLNREPHIANLSAEAVGINGLGLGSSSSSNESSDSTDKTGRGLKMAHIVEIPPSDPVDTDRYGFAASLLPPPPVQLMDVAAATATVSKLPMPPTSSTSLTPPSAPATAAEFLTTSSMPSHGSLVVPVVVPIASPSDKSPVVGGNTLATPTTTHQSSLPGVALLSVTALSSGITLSQPFTNASLKEAVKLWCENKSAAVANFGDISTWNTSQVTSMRELYKGCSNFNDPIGNWDVSNVTDMYLMFFCAASFNQSLDSWNVSKVTTMFGMFWQASSFRQPLNSWDVGNVTQMGYMFSSASSFNQPLNSWDVKSVTNMEGMFYHAVSFNQPLDTWNVSSVVDMRWMFDGAAAFNQSLEDWEYNKNVDRTDMLKDTAAINR